MQILRRHKIYLDLIILEIKDTYVGREDCLVSVFVSFGIPDKKFGPADDEDEERSARKILTITERLSLPEGAEPRDSIAERVFDLEEESIKLKFHRDKDRILSQVYSRMKDSTTMLFSSRLSPSTDLERDTGP